MNDIWFLKYKVRQAEFFFHFGPFLPFQPPDNQENQNHERSNYLHRIIDIKILWCATKSIIFFSIFRALTVSLLHFLYAFSCKQRWQLYHEWCSSLWVRFVKNKDIPDLFPKQETLATFHSGHNAALKNLS